MLGRALRWRPRRTERGADEEVVDADLVLRAVEHELLLLHKILELLHFRLARLVLPLQLLDQPERVVQAHRAAGLVHQLLHKDGAFRLPTTQERGRRRTWVRAKETKKRNTSPSIPPGVPHHRRRQVRLRDKVDAQVRVVVFVRLADVLDVRDVVRHRHTVDGQDDRLLLLGDEDLELRRLLLRDVLRALKRNLVALLAVPAVARLRQQPRPRLQIQLGRQLFLVEPALFLVAHFRRRGIVPRPPARVQPCPVGKG